MPVNVIQGSFAHGLSRVMQLPLQRKAPALRFPLQRNVTALPLPPSVARLTAVGGVALAGSVRQAMEAAFGARFHDVRVHVTPQVLTLGAEALTSGSHIHFAPGRYDPSSAHGRRLLAHELAHVVQQRSGRARNPFVSGDAILHDPALEAEAQRLALRAAVAPPRAVQPARAVQRLLVTIGDPDNSGVDFPALATVLIAKLTGNTAATMSTVVAPKPGFWAKLVGAGAKKETLYICAHGTKTGITGYKTADELATALKAKGLDDTTLTKIVLVSCIVGGTNVRSSGDVFARRLAELMNVDVYAPYDLITVHYDVVKSGGLTQTRPTKFSIRDTDVAVIEGEGLTKFDAGSGTGYAPPLPESTMALL